MGNSGVRHFTEKFRLFHLDYRDVLLEEEERNELDHRVAVPFKNYQSTNFAFKELKHVNRVQQTELMKLDAFVNEEKARTATAKPSLKQKQTTGNKRKRSVIDHSSAPKAKIQKSSPRPDTPDSIESPKFDAERLKLAIELFEKVNAVSRRYNGPNGHIIPSVEYRQHLRQKATPDHQANHKKALMLEPVSSDIHEKMYQDMLCSKISETIISWTRPSTDTTPRLHGDTPQPRRYGQNQETALAFIIRAFWSYPPLQQARSLYDQLMPARDPDLEALASTIESWENSIRREVKKNTYTLQELEVLRPQIRFAECLSRNLRHEHKDRRWSNWYKAREAAKVALEAERAKIAIGKVVRRIESENGDRLLPERATPLSSLPLHMRRRMKNCARGRRDEDSFTGDHVPSVGLSLEIHAKIVGRSKLSIIVAGAGADDGGISNSCVRLNKSASLSATKDLTVNKQKPVVWSPET
ncbi:hypothetical protein BKA65DRAFT_477546 [Rhexocercosporidium sp. MPI-PUGE-AT-0058]|nr:hypothetical protein BKA65DRAFT_477546 [Rhexocercosporidium sp. MPI-PUGE-AT-0058]